MTFWRFVAGAEAVLLLLLVWAIGRLLDLLAAQRTRLADQATTLRLYRDARTESDRQIRELLSQNDRLAMQVFTAAAARTAMPAAPVPPARYPAGVES